MAKKVEKDGLEWHKRVRQLAYNWLPAIRQCLICGSPVVDGYVCSFCGKDDSEIRQKAREAVRKELRAIDRKDKGK